MLPEYAVVMTLETYIFILVALGVHVITAGSLESPIWLVLLLGMATFAALALTLALYAQTWSVDTWVQEPSWDWFVRLKLLVFDENVSLSVTRPAIATAAHGAFVFFAGAWLALTLHVLAVWLGDEGHVDGLWHTLFRRDLSQIEAVSNMKLNVLVAMTLRGVLALLMLPVATFVRGMVRKKEDPVEEILENRQNGLVYTVVCVSLLIQYTVHLQPTVKMMSYEEKYLLFALLPLLADVLADGLLARRLTLKVLCEPFSYMSALGLVVLACGAPAAALVFVFLEQHMFVFPQFFAINVGTLTLLLSSRALDCHLAITYAREQQAERQEEQDAASSRWGRGTKQPKFFFRRIQKKKKNI